MVFKNDRLLTADLDGQIRSWSNDGISTKTGTLVYKSPISFIRFNSKGDNVITQHDNLDLLLWDIRSIDTKGAIYQELKGHSNLISSVAFSKDEKYMATGGNDSLIIVWEMRVLPASKVKTIKTQSAVKSVIFCNTDSIIYAQEDGSVILQNINLNMNQTLINSGPDYYLSLAWNNDKKIVYAGGVSGNLIIRDLSKTAESPDVYNPQSAGAGIDLITLNPDLSLLATSSWDRTINLYYCKEYFENRDVVGGVVHLKNLNYRTRSLVFTDNGMLVAALADKSVHFWEISSSMLAEMICNLVGRDMTIDEWKFYVGSEIPYEKSCGKNP
jgi:WD40 repeat protein